MKTNGTPSPDEPPLAAALRACADGLYPAEAAAELFSSRSDSLRATAPRPLDPARPRWEAWFLPDLSGGGSR
jgi:hypothetical protein